MAGWVQLGLAAYSLFDSHQQQKRIEKQQRDLIKSQRKPPTIDDARQRQIDQDRMRRRRGVLGNIYGGANPTKPTVGTPRLTGFSAPDEPLG